MKVEVTVGSRSTLWQKVIAAVSEATEAHTGRICCDDDAGVDLVGRDDDDGLGGFELDLVVIHLHASDTCDAEMP